MRSESATSRWREIAARDPRVSLALAAVYTVCAIVLVRRDTFLNNEGIFSYICARIAGEGPIPTLFLLKSRPPLALFYALPAALGFDAFAIVHSVVAAAAIPLTFALARAAGQRRPNLAAGLVALSAMVLATGPCGVGNSDGMTLAVLSAVLLAAWDRPAFAGVVAALAVLSRTESAILVAGVGVHAALIGRRGGVRFTVGLVGLGLLYAALGAIYHRDPIWFLHYPPHVTHSDPYSEIMGRQLFGGEPHKVVVTLLTLTPAIGLLPFARWSALSRAERVLGGSVLVFVGILSTLPALRPLNFGDMPRYVLPAVPFIALLLGRAIEVLSDDPAPGRATWILGTAWLAGLLVVGHFQEAQHRAPALLWAVAGWSLVVLVAATALRWTVPALVLALAGGAALPLLPATRLALNPDTIALGRHLIADAPPSAIVLTNVSELPLWLTRNGGARLDVRHMQAADQRYEFDTLTDEAVGQRAVLRELLRRHWYGPIVFGEDVQALIRPGTWLALREDARTSHILREAWLEGRSETITVGNRARIVRVVAP